MALMRSRISMLVVAPPGHGRGRTGAMALIRGPPLRSSSASRWFASPVGSISVTPEINLSASISPAARRSRSARSSRGWRREDFGGSAFRLTFLCGCSAAFVSSGHVHALLSKRRRDLLRGQFRRIDRVGRQAVPIIVIAARASRCSSHFGVAGQTAACPPRSMNARTSLSRYPTRRALSWIFRRSLSTAETRSSVLTLSRNH